MSAVACSMPDPATRHRDLARARDENRRSAEIERGRGAACAGEPSAESRDIVRPPQKPR